MCTLNLSQQSLQGGFLTWFMLYSVDYSYSYYTSIYLPLIIISWPCHNNLIRLWITENCIMCKYSLLRVHSLCTSSLENPEMICPKLLEGLMVKDNTACVCALYHQLSTTTRSKYTIQWLYGRCTVPRMYGNLQQCSHHRWMLVISPDLSFSCKEQQTCRLLVIQLSWGYLYTCKQECITSKVCSSTFIYWWSQLNWCQRSAIIIIIKTA